MRGIQAAAVIVLSGAVALAGDPFVDEQNTWRAKRDERLRTESGWLTLVGLAWLEEGENAFGSDPSLAVPLPEGKAPRRAGSFFLEKGKVRVVASDDSGVLLQGKPVGARAIVPDDPGPPDVLRLGDLSFFVIRRGDRFGVRVRDAKAKTLLEFEGMDYFPADPKWKIEARWEAYDAPRDVPIPNVLGQIETMKAIGLARFVVEGKEQTLEPVLSEGNPPSLWFIFKDATAGRETYPGGRFLYSGLPKDGRVVLDFNQAYNPPCVFTPYATCPLPPKKNSLSVRVEAGEKTFGKH